MPLSIDKYSYLIIESLDETKTYYMQLFYEVDSFYGALKIANKFVDNNLITDMFPYAFRNAYLSESLTLKDFFVFDFFALIKCLPRNGGRPCRIGTAF